MNRTNVIVKRYSVTLGIAGRTNPIRTLKTGNDIPAYAQYLKVGEVRTDAGEKVDIVLRLYFWEYPNLVRGDSVTVDGEDYRVVAILPRRPSTSISEYEVECMLEDRSFA